jgi:hypothetical protein
MPDVRLVDLEVIKRYSLAVRRDAVPADELLAALDASRDTVLAAIGSKHAAKRRTAGKGAREAPATSASRAARTAATQSEAMSKELA